MDLSGPISSTLTIHVVSSRSTVLLSHNNVSLSPLNHLEPLHSSGAQGFPLTFYSSGMITAVPSRKVGDTSDVGIIIDTHFTIRTCTSLTYMSLCKPDLRSITDL